MANRLYKNCDHLLGVKGALGKRSDGTTQVLNNGTCTFTVTDLFDGSVLTSGTIPYVTASAGDYMTTVDATEFSGVKVGRRYKVVFQVTCEGFNSESEMDAIGAAYSP